MPLQQLPEPCRCSPGHDSISTQLPASTQRVPAASPSLPWAAAGGQLHSRNPRSQWLGRMGPGKKEEIAGK